MRVFALVLNYRNANMGLPGEGITWRSWDESREAGAGGGSAPSPGNT